MCIDVFGEEWEEFEIAHMSTADGIGIELFSFPHGIKEAQEFNPFNTGLFHFCVQDPNIEALTKKIVYHGGKQRMPIREYYPNENPYKIVYVQDPLGIVFSKFTPTVTSLLILLALTKNKSVDKAVYHSLKRNLTKYHVGNQN
jgi:hypothetical protein